MSIKGDVQELISIQNELTELAAQRKIINTRVKKLREKANEAEERIQTYIRLKQLPGVKYQGTVITLKPKTTRAPKKKQQRDEDGMAVLRELGIENAKDAYEKIMEARRGTPLEDAIVRIEKMKI